jgi:SmpA / OmlA family
MKHALVALPIAFVVAGCVHAATVEQIHAGMDRSQVAALMGPPETTSNTAGRECATYIVTKDFWSRVPWDMTDRYYVCFTDGKVDTFGKADQKSG